MARVLVTGATGFIAGHCIAALLAQGRAVRGTVRDLTNEARLAHLRALEGDLELVQADLEADAGWREAVAGCDGVLHTASPLPLGDPDDADAVIGPAVQGTTRVLRACAGTDVKRVVVTSSVAAILGTDTSHTYTEADWAEPTSVYARSKMLAERAAWDLVQGLADDERFELATLCPSLVLGPLQAPRVNASAEPVRALLSRAYPAFPRLGWPVVDVRDVAQAHVEALDRPRAAGNRYILAGEHVWMQDMARILAEALGSQGFRPPTRRMPTLLMRLVALFDPTVRSRLAQVGRRLQYDITAAQADLGFTPRPAREAVIAMGRSLVDFGLVGR